MSRTQLFLAAAILLSAAALVVRPPRRADGPRPPPSPTRQVATVRPFVPPPAVIPAAAFASGPVSLTARLGHRVLPAKPSRVFARIDLAARAEGVERARQPIAIALVLDRSGSMAGEKLESARGAALELIDSLREGDELAILHYGSDVTTSARVRIDADSRGSLRERVSAIRSEGGTNISEALSAGKQALAGFEGARRLILVSDGQPTEGIVGSQSLAAMAGRAREEGIAVSALGVGVDYNDELMRGLANYGGGFYAFLPRASQLRPILQRELDQATRTVASSVQLRLRAQPGARIRQIFDFPHVADAPGRTAEVSVYDLAGGGTAQLLLELEVDPGAAALLDVELEYWTPEKERRAAVVKLEATRSEDEAALEAGRDLEVEADGLRAVGGRQIAEATRAFEAGDRKRGFELFESVRQLFGSSAEALSGDLAALEAAEASLGSSSGSALKSEAKSVRKSSGYFGMSNSY